MNKARALKTAIELTQTALAANEGKFYPTNANSADGLADFIEELAKRLESMGDSAD